MATIKLIFRGSSVAGEEGALYFRVIHKRMTRQIHTGCHISADEWDEESGEVRCGVDGVCSERLQQVMTRIKDGIQRLGAIVADLERLRKEYTVGEVVEKYLAADTVVGFISYARRLIRDTRCQGKRTTAEHYASALNSFIRYHGTQEVPFGELDRSMVSDYEQYLRRLDLCSNTTSYYMRNLRSIYNHAASEDLTASRDPFRHVYTGVAKTVKRAVSIDALRRLYRLELGGHPLMELARDLFIFSFLTRGMAFVDLAYLKKSDIKNGYLRYRRQKTSQLLAIRWEKPMREIAERYCSDESEYVFPLITQPGGDLRRQYLNAYKAFSRRLRKLGECIGLTEALTFHRARHTWASIARLNKVPLSVIKEGMGHDSERTTQIYLASIDTSEVDNANSKIIRLLKQ